ncbi:hypothetical protein [Reyranella sp.]|uniref:hypothetical protein n=1 Tax=Reyranella sp. TaxID=1929291 RepID=UPI0025D9337C|nr:hypothetical protein [Reyranella sp.]
MARTIDSRFAIAGFSVACVVGLIGAFVGLDYKSMWIDELLTAGIVEPGGRPGTLFSRIASDLNSPLYSVTLALYSKVVGTSDSALRSFSALAACAAILLFAFGTRRSFSLPARLFGAAMATGSFYWVVQSQNARNYALALLIGSGILVVSLALLAGDKDGDDDRLQSRRVFVLLTLCVVACFTHFYLVIAALSALFVLFLVRRRHRLLMVAGAFGVLLITAAYVGLFVVNFAKNELGNNWLQNNLDWYVGGIKGAAILAFGKIGRMVLVLCVVVLLVRGAGWRHVALGKFPYDPVTALTAAVPLLVLIGGISSSLLIAPNFTSRYLLICAPFLWGLCARLYDALQSDRLRAVRLGANIALPVAVLAMATIVMDRLRPSTESMLWSEPFRLTADWISNLPECRDQIVPVLNTDSPSWFKPGYAEEIYENAYGRYLKGHARPRMIFSEDLKALRLPQDVKADLRRRVDGEGCPVLLWGVHLVRLEDMEAATKELALVIDRQSLTEKSRIRTFQDGFQGYILEMDRVSPASPR